MLQHSVDAPIQEESAIPAIDLSSPPSSQRAVLTAPNKMVPGSERDLDLPSTERLLETAAFCFGRRDFKSAARLLEQALPALDRLYSNNESGKFKALRLLRDSYLAQSKAVEAKDCAEVMLSVFEDIMSQNTRFDSTIGLGDPAAFTRPVIRKLKTLRRAKESEYLRRRSTDISEKWNTFCKTT